MKDLFKDLVARSLKLKGSDCTPAEKDQNILYRRVLIAR
jgi:hypothetical protein